MFTRENGSPVRVAAERPPESPVRVRAERVARPQSLRWLGLSREMRPSGADVAPLALWTGAWR